MHQGQHHPFGDEAFEQTVRERAYALWERDGSPHGLEKHYWFLALEQCLRRRDDAERLTRGLVDPM